MLSCSIIWNPEWGDMMIERRAVIIRNPELGGIIIETSAQKAGTPNGVT